MPESKPSFSDRLYTALLRLLPFDFRAEFATEMEEVFHEQRTETRRRNGLCALAAMWAVTIFDLLRMAPREHLSVLVQDARYALRMMRKNLAYTAVAVLILGLGIGVNTSVFSAVNSVLLKPLPYIKGDDLVVLRQPVPRLNTEDARFSVQEMNDIRRQSRSLGGVVEYHTMNFLLLGRNDAHRVRAAVVSANFFDLFGVKPLLGRTFLPADDEKGAPPVLVLSYEFWQQAEGADPNIVGKVFEMNDKPHTVIGVLPPIPQYPSESDVYMPTVACPYRSNPQTIAGRDRRLVRLFGRLKPGNTAEHCHADLSVIQERLKQDYPKFYPQGIQASASPLRTDLTSRARPMLLVLLGAAACVLLIACANVANLILARMASREQELVIRTAVGAGAGRLLRQLLTESLIMALLAASAGVLFASGSIKLMAQFAGQLTPRAREIAIDGRVLLFAVLCAFATTIIFGSIAALYSRHDVSSGLKEAGRASAEKSRGFLRAALIAAQVGFSYVLLIGAGLMVRSFIQLNRVDPGFVPQRVLAAGFDLNWSRYTSDDQGRAFVRRLVENVEGRPGVLSVAIASSFPMDPDISFHGARSARFQVEGETRPESELPAANWIIDVTPSYFPTLGIPIVAGRPFLDADNPDAPPAIIINRSLARALWRERDPIGRRISFDRGQHWRKIVGVAGDTKDFGLSHETPNQVYIPMAQNPNPGSLLVRSAGDPNGVRNLVRRAVLGVDPQTAITHMETLEEARADSMAYPRTSTRLFSLFGGLALVIALAGIGSMLALGVRQRTREIGIRMALGAAPLHIQGTVVRRGMLLAGVGLAAGFAGSIFLAKFLKSFLFQVEPTDAATYALVSALLLAAALIASWWPARRASRIDPQIALRCD